MEKFDFSKIEDQKKFDNLPEKEREEIVDYGREEAEKIKEMVIKERQLIEAHEHWQRGFLGVTDEDHRALGGTPDLELSQNPRKTLGEIWSIDKIREKLEKGVTFLERARKNYKREYEGDPRYLDNRWYKDDILNEKDELRKTMLYLKSIGKLPKEFENIEIQDMESDPKEK